MKRLLAVFFTACSLAAVTLIVLILTATSAI